MTQLTNNPTLISGSVLEALLSGGKIPIGAFGAPRGVPQFTTQELGAAAWYQAPQDTPVATNAIPINKLTFVPFITSGRALILNGVAFVIQALGTAGSVARVGIYTSDPVTLKPALLLADGGQVATDAGSTLVLRESTTSEILLQPYSLYWGAYVCGVAAPTVQSNGAPTIFGSVSTSSGPASYWGFSAGFPYAALPTQAPATGLDSSAGGLAGAAVYFRFARPA